VQIHRAHTLGRQAEILRDALLHSFSTIDNLHPHEVIVLCADIEAAAPLLRATFEEPLTLGSGERVKIPFVVADRTLRETSIGAELAADILSLIGSRFDVDSVVNIATHELVLKNAYMGSGDVDAWLRHIHNTRVRWGLDVQHRKVNGLDAPDITAHTWKQLVDRTLLGALLPDAEETMFEMGDIVPVPRIDTTEIEALTGFAEVLSVLASLEHDSQFCIGYGFSDQMYLIRTEEFRRPIYNEHNEKSSNYPDYGGELFEKRVNSWMLNHNRYRVTYLGLSYKHRNFSNKNWVRQLNRLFDWQ
jgi:exonuclease V gamma subunit